jgi:uncharacterized alpha-E superfamily protein
MAAISARLGSEVAEWRALITATGSDAGFYRKYAAPDAESAVHWLVFDSDNPSGILSCFEAARRNARAVRTALTVEMWEALNDSWNHLRDLSPDATEGENLADFLGWVRERVTLFYGAAQDTMLRNEAWRFVHLGTMLERADNTARLLDVKHQLFAPAAEDAVDYVQWQAVLRSISALRAYQWIYRDQLSARKIAELTILRPEVPRSLAACHAEVADTLEAIAIGQGGRTGECHRLSGLLKAQLRYGRIDDILAEGLHSFLTGMISRSAELGTEIDAFYIRH